MYVSSCSTPSFSSPPFSSPANSSPANSTIPVNRGRMWRRARTWKLQELTTLDTCRAVHGKCLVEHNAKISLKFAASVITRTLFHVCCRAVLSSILLLEYLIEFLSSTSVFEYNCRWPNVERSMLDWRVLEKWHYLSGIFRHFWQQHFLCITETVYVSNRETDRHRLVSLRVSVA